jgi:hypothetical protein
MNNKPQKTYDLPCFIFIAIIIVLVIILKAVKFFGQPNAIDQIIDFLQATGLCLGVVIFLLLLMYCFATISKQIKGRFIIQSSDFSVRFISRKMEKIGYWQNIPENISEDPTQEINHSKLASMVITNYGVWIKEIKSEKSAKNNNTYWIEDNDEFLDNLLIPISSINLYYVTYKPEGNFEIEFKPPESIGFKDEIPQVSKEDQLKLIIIFTLAIKKNELQKTIQLKQPVKLKLTVLDKNNKDDLFATARFYKLIYEKIKENVIEEDDSWMYRSRPIYW